MADQAVEALVAKAYSAIARPENFVDLLHDIVETEPNLAQLDDRASHHFTNAANILDELYPAAEGDQGAGRIAAPAHPPCDMLLGPGLSVRLFDARIFADANLVLQEPLPEWMFDPVSLKEDRRRLSTTQAEHRFGFVRLYASPESEETRWFSFRQYVLDEETVVLIDAVRLRWDEDHGRAFGDAFGLTATEMALVEHLVTGGTTRSFAEERGRSIGTARNQMKALLRKLVINSKEKLLLLYAGFIHSLEKAQDDEASIRHQCANLVTLGPSQDIAWEEYGDPDGLPVLYFHPLEGPMLPPSTANEAWRQGLRIIAPWRPFYGETSGDKIGPAALEQGAQLLAALLDRLGVAKCTGLATQAGTPYMAAFARYCPDRIGAALTAGPFLPLTEKSDFAFVKRRQRSHVRIARAAPAFARIFQRAMLATLGTREFSRFAEDFYEDCPAELAVIHDPEIMTLFRKATSYGMAQTTEGLVDTMLVWASDWSALIDEAALRMEIMIGSLDCNCDPKFAALSAARHGMPEPIIVPEAGSFLIYEAPQPVMARLRALAEA